MSGKTKISKSFSLVKHREEEQKKKGIYKMKKKKKVNKNNKDYSQKGFF